MKRLSESSSDFRSSPAKENFDFLISAKRLVEMSKDGTEINDNFLEVFYSIHPVLIVYGTLLDKLEIVKFKVINHLRKNLRIRNSERNLKRNCVFILLINAIIRLLHIINLIRKRFSRFITVSAR